MKQALVTGASGGIGRAFAMSLAKNDYAVTGVARNETRLKELVAQLGSKHSYIVADLSTKTGLEKIQAAMTMKNKWECCN